MRYRTATIQMKASVIATKPSSKVQAIEPWMVGDRLALRTVAP